jgi:hypothetical protein
MYAVAAKNLKKEMSVRFDVTLHLLDGQFHTKTDMIEHHLIGHAKIEYLFYTLSSVRATLGGADRYVQYQAAGTLTLYGCGFEHLP